MQTTVTFVFSVTGGDDIMNYQDINAKMIDTWCESGWEWGKVITHEEYVKALNGEWNVLLTPTNMYLMNGLENYVESVCLV